MRKIHPGSVACQPCIDENPDQFIAFPTVCPHRTSTAEAQWDKPPHPALTEAVAALLKKPICPHVTVVTMAQSGRCDACTAAVVVPVVLRWAAGCLDHDPAWLRVVANQIEAEATT